MFVPTFKISTAIAALLVAILMGPACGNSGPKTIARDGEVGTGNQAGSTISSGTAGGTSGTIGPGGGGGTSGGAGGPAGAGGQGGTAGSPPGQGGACGAISVCITGQTVNWVQGKQDLSGDCPAERECYSLYSGCSTTLCVLPDGAHCGDLACNPGDTQIPSYAECGGPTRFCYPKNSVCAIHCV
jgi:hypothetical protein